MSTPVPDDGSPVAESPLDRLRRLARESTAAKAAAAQRPAAPAAPEVPAPAEPTLEEPVFSEPSFVAPTFDEPTFDEPTFDEPTFTATATPGVPVLAPAAAELATDEDPVSEQPGADDATEVEPAREVPTPEVTPEPPVRPGPPSTARRRGRAPQPVAELPVAVPEVMAPTVVLDRTPAPRSLKVVTATLAVLVLLAAVGLILSIHHERSTNDPVKERAAATAAAIKVVSDTTTLDYRNLDDWLRRVQADSTDGSTPGKGLRSDFANQKDLLVQATASNKSVSVGRVATSVYCGGSCATSQVAGNTASALVFATARVTSTSSPAGLDTPNRFTVKLIKVNGRWLATMEDDVPVAPAS